MDSEKGFWNKTNVILGIIASICTIGGISIFGDISIIDIFKAKFTKQEVESSYVYENTEPPPNIETTVSNTNEEDISPIETETTSTQPSTTEAVEITTTQAEGTTDPNSVFGPSVPSTYTVGWLQDEGRNWKWRYEDGSFQYFGWLAYNGNDYYFENELMVTGWYQIDGDWYFFDESGAMQVNIWVDNYYLGNDGIMLTNTESNIDGNWYSFDADGIASLIRSGTIPYPDYPESPYILPSALAFSDDCYAGIDGRYDEFYLVGNITSNYPLTSITYEYYTPNTYSEYPYNGCIDINSDSCTKFDLNRFDNIINSVESNYEYSGEYRFTIFAEDSSGERNSISLYWQY